MRWDVCVKMKEKELVSFVSFAVQFCKVCAVYVKSSLRWSKGRHSTLFWGLQLLVHTVISSARFIFQLAKGDVICDWLNHAFTTVGYAWLVGSLTYLMISFTHWTVSCVLYYRLPPLFVGAQVMWLRTVLMLISQGCSSRSLLYRMEQFCFCLLLVLLILLSYTDWFPQALLLNSVELVRFIILSSKYCLMNLFVAYFGIFITKRYKQHIDSFIFSIFHILDAIWMLNCCVVKKTKSNKILRILTKLSFLSLIFWQCLFSLVLLSRVI